MTGVTVKFQREKQRLVRLRNELEYLANHKGRVGWVDPTKMHPVEEGQKVPVSMATIARTMNYGREAGVASNGRAYPAIPARPFMKITFDQRSDDLKRIINMQFARLLRGKIDGKQLIDSSCLNWSSFLRKTIRTSSNFTPLSRLTVASRKRRNKTLSRKRANTPLIDTGALIESIGYEVVSK